MECIAKSPSANHLFTVTVSDNGKKLSKSHI